MTGIDVPIALLREAFALNLWTSTVNKVFYSLVDRNLSREGNIIGEVFKSGKEYEEVQFDDKRNMVCFFDSAGDLNGLSDAEENTRDVGIVFAVNIPKVYPSLTYRAKEELYRDVIAVIEKYQKGSTEPNTITVGLPAYGDLSTEGLRQYNMQPWHTFRVNTTMKFTLSNCPSPTLTYPYPDQIIV